MNLRRACEHGEWMSHPTEGKCPYADGPERWSCNVVHSVMCPGGTEPTIVELLEMLVAEGVLEQEDYNVGSRTMVRLQTTWQEVSP